MGRAGRPCFGRFFNVRASWSFGPLAAILSLLSHQASAASFDCAKARTGIEKQICADADVSRQDGLLQETYEKLLKEVADPEKLQAEQREWVKERDHCHEAGAYNR